MVSTTNLSSRGWSYFPSNGSLSRYHYSLYKTKRSRLLIPQLCQKSSPKTAAKILRLFPNPFFSMCSRGRWLEATSKGFLAQQNFVNFLQSYDDLCMTFFLLDRGENSCDDCSQYKQNRHRKKKQNRCSQYTFYIFCNPASSMRCIRRGVLET